MTEPLKPCLECKKLLPLSKYYPVKGQKYVRSMCKKCDAIASRLYWLRNRERLSKKRQGWELAYKDKRKEQYKNIKRDPYKAMVRRTSHRCIELGLLEKGTKCTQCSSKKHIEMHHPDYDDPFDIVWLCRKCHYEIHRPLKDFSHDGGQDA